MISEKDYVVTQGWMVSELHLKGLEKEVYAIIYGFTRSSQGKFTGSLQYICDWTLASKQGVTKALASLVDKKLLARTEVYYNNVKFVEYSAVGVYNSVYHYATELPENHTTELGGIQLSCTNNISNTYNKESISNIESKDSNYNTKEKFSKPTLEELQNYVKEKNYHFDPEAFLNHYESVGWKVGKSPMKDWKAACSTWEKNWKSQHPQDDDCPYTFGVHL